MFITFEGIDSSGKTTQISLLKEYFIQRNKEVFVVRDPGGTKVSEEIRKILLSKNNFEMVKECELFLFCASRAQLVNEVIIPKLRSNIIVISDRFFDSTTAYQGYGRDLNIEDIKVLHKIAINGTPPDLTFYIDIDYEESHRRQVRNNIIPDRMESGSKEFFEKIRNGYLEIAKSEQKRFKVLDGLKPKNELHNEIVFYIEKFEKEKNEKI